MPYGAIPHLAALATDVPGFVLAQDDVAAAISRMFAGTPSLAHLMPVFANTGIATRHAAAPLSWFEAPQNWPARNKLYLETAVPLLEALARRVLDQAGIAARDVGAIVTVSTTGIATPSLDARLITGLDLPPTVQRLPIFGLGCAGGVLGLGRAATMAASMPDKAVLFLVVELCSLTFRREDASKSNIVGAALFGDGAAAAVAHCGGPGPAIIAQGEHTWPDSLDVMGWEVATNGLQPVFSRDIPALILDRLGPVADSFLEQAGIPLSAVDRFVCHPGGPKVLAACEEVFGLQPGSLNAERLVLQEFGNMSAATVLFVLERVLEEARHADLAWEHMLLTALGPGFSAGFAMLRNQ